MMSGRKELMEMLQTLALKNDLDRSAEMKAIQVLAIGITHCLRSLDGIEATQKQMLDQR
jgi:hypothetical protein